MPKINLPELDALAEYLTGKVPRLGMFSTLKGLLDNSPRDVMTAQEWGGYLKPGQIATRAGVEFPLKKEELEYSGIPDFLKNFKPNERISRDNLLGLYHQNAPNLNLTIGSREADSSGNTPETLALAGQGIESDAPPWRVETQGPTHSQYSHAAGGDSPQGATSPFGDQRYQLSVTRGTPEQIGEYSSHFSPQDISWSRTNQLPMEPFNPDNPHTYDGPTMRVIDEIQSDRHQAAIKKQFRGFTPDQQTHINKLMRQLSDEYGVDNLRRAWDPDEETDEDVDENVVQKILEDPRFSEVTAIRKSGFQPRGYADQNAIGQKRALQDQIRELSRRSTYGLVNEHGEFNVDTDPDIAQQIQNLQRKLMGLENQVPDTPFKTTQGYVGLEMRKALNDALQSGDRSIGLATGNDQNSFYGRRFNPDQRSGQNYNYNVSYPPVLEKLAKQYGLEFGPQSVHLLGPSDNPDWPLPYMRRAQGVVGGEAEPGVDTAMEFIRRQYEPYDWASQLNRFLGAMTERIPLENQEELGLRSYDDQGNPVTGTSANTGFNRIANARQRMVEAERNIRQLRGRFQNEGNEIEPDTIVPGETAQNLLFQRAQEDALNELRPIWEAYRDIHEPDPAEAGKDPRIQQKTFQNAFHLGDDENIARLKQAGVPVFEKGGEVDHVGHALHRMGFHFRGNEPPQGGEAGEAGPMAEGGEVKGDTAPDYSSSLNKLKNAAQAGAAAYYGAGNTDLPTRAVRSFAKQVYGAGPDGRVEGFWSGHIPLAAYKLGSVPYSLAKLWDMVQGPYSPSSGLSESDLLGWSKRSGQVADTLEKKLDASAPMPEATTLPQHMAEHASDIIPIPGLEGEGVLSHIAGFLGASGVKNYPRMAGEWDVINSAIDTLTGKGKQPQSPTPEDLAHHAAASAPGDFSQAMHVGPYNDRGYAGGGEVGVLEEILGNKNRLQEAMERLESWLSKPELDKDTREDLQTKYLQGLEAHHAAVTNPTPENLQNLTQAVDQFKQISQPYETGSIMGPGPTISPSGPQPQFAPVPDIMTGLRPLTIQDWRAVDPYANPGPTLNFRDE